MKAFCESLKEKGWEERWPYGLYEKGEWAVSFDTGSWAIVGNKNNPNIFPIHVPGESESGWTVNLIEHLCKMEDERFRLWKALELVASANPVSTAENKHAREALRSCYHRWLDERSLPKDPITYRCAICGRQKGSADDA